MGSIKDSIDVEQLKANNITHILSIHENPKERHHEVDIKFIIFIEVFNNSMFSF